MMSMKRGVIVLLLVLLVALLTACGERECKKDEDCTKNNCFQSECDSGTCVHNPISACCGNEKCEKDDGENKCTCASDCGKCVGTTEGGLIYKCSEDQQCISIEDTSVKQNFRETPVHGINDKDKEIGRLFVTYDYESPFNVNRDLFKTELRWEGLPNSVTDFTIKKVRVVHITQIKDAKGKVTEEKAEILGSTDVNQVLHDDRMTANDEINLKKVKIDPDPIEVTLEVFYTYKIADKGVIRDVAGSVSQKVQIKLIKPVLTKECPTCEVRACANATCGQDTTYFCKYNYRGACCGNRICELNENKCTCPEDCGECYTSHGKWIKDTCFNMKCVGKVLNADQITPTILSDTRNLKQKVDDEDVIKVTTVVKYRYMAPFDINKDKFHIEMIQSFLEDDVEGFQIKRIELLSGNQLLAEHQVAANLRREGDRYTWTLSPIVSLVKNEEQEFDLKVKIHYRYTWSDADVIEDSQYTYAIGKVLFINPEVSSYS